MPESSHHLANSFYVERLTATTFTRLQTSLLCEGLDESKPNSCFSGYACPPNGEPSYFHSCLSVATAVIAPAHQALAGRYVLWSGLTFFLLQAQSKHSMNKSAVVIVASMLLVALRAPFAGSLSFPFELASHRGCLPKLSAQSLSSVIVCLKSLSLGPSARGKPPDTCLGQRTQCVQDTQ